MFDFYEKSELIVGCCGTDPHKTYVEIEIPGMDALSSRKFTQHWFCWSWRTGDKANHLQNTLDSGRKINNSQLPDDYEPGCFHIFATEMYNIVKPNISFILMDLENMVKLLPQMELFLYKMLLS